jgi:hypothetical protein
MHNRFRARHTRGIRTNSAFYVRPVSAGTETLTVKSLTPAHAQLALKNVDVVEMVQT